MSKLSKLLSSVEAVSEEVSSHDMETNSGGSFINSCGVFPTTIEKAFLTSTKKGGVALNLHFGGANIFNAILYIVSKKNGKMVTTCQMQGKTVSLPSYKMFKQLYFLATGEGLALEEIETDEETITYKDYGKDVTVEAETITALIGKEVEIGVRLEEMYATKPKDEREGDNDFDDKTQLKVNDDGDVIYKKELESIFSKEGFSAQEVLAEATETKARDSKVKFFESDKAIKKVKLEEPEFGEGEEGEVTEGEADDPIEF